MTLLAAAGPRAYWYLARGTGVVALLLLTAAVVLGILGSMRFSAAPRWPRFAIDTVHRDVSLLVIVLLVLHVLTSVLDGFAPIKLTDAVIPLASSYRPLWLGLGALSFDLLLALVVTSLIRRHLGYNAWRAIHWLAYASWPVAVLHGLGTGSDAKSWWLLALTTICVAIVVFATLFRIADQRFEYPGLRAPAVALSIATPVGVAIFTLAGPLAPGWAGRAGTPAQLLSKSSAPVSGAAHRSSSQGGDASGPFSGALSGTLTQTPEPGGEIVDLALSLSGSTHGTLRVRIAGAPLADGGISMAGSQVDLSIAGAPSVLAGQIVSLQGQNFQARVSGGSSTALELQADLSVDGQSGNVTGTLSATPARRGS